MNLLFQLQGAEKGTFWMAYNCFKNSIKLTLILVALTLCHKVVCQNKSLSKKEKIAYKTYLDLPDGLTYKTHKDDSSYYYLALAKGLMKSGQHDLVYKNLYDCIQNSDESKNQDYKAFAYENIAWLFLRINRYEKSISAINQFERFTTLKQNEKKIRVLLLKSNLENARNNYTLSQTIQDNIELLVPSESQIFEAITAQNKCRINLDFDKVHLDQIRKSITLNNQFKLSNTENFLLIGEYFREQHLLDSAIYYLQISLSQSIKNENKLMELYSYDQLHPVYSVLNQKKDALKYIKKSQDLYEDIYGSNILKLYQVEKTEAENSINFEKIAIETESSNIQLKITKNKQYLLLSLLFCLLATGLIIYRGLRSRHKQNMLQLNNVNQHQKEMHLINQKMMRAQLNSYFLFNNLNTIKSYIAKEKPREATRYLNKLALFFRKKLNDSQKTEISLGAELENIKIYVDIERFRLNEKIVFNTFIAPTIDEDKLFVTPSSIQSGLEVLLKTEYRATENLEINLEIFYDGDKRIKMVLFTGAIKPENEEDFISESIIKEFIIKKYSIPGISGDQYMVSSYLEQRPKE